VSLLLSLRWDIYNYRPFVYLQQARRRLCYLAGMRKTAFVSALTFYVSLFCLATLAMICLPTSAQDAPPAAVPVKETPAAAMPSDPKELMLLAAKTNGLTGDDVKPWHLKATWKMFDEKGGITDQGIYEEFWASPTKYKRTFTGTAFTQTDYGTPRGVLRSGLHQLLPALIGEVRDEFVTPLPNSLTIEHEDFNRSQRTIDGEKLICLKLTGVRVDPGLFYCLAKDKPILRMRSFAMKSIEILHDHVIVFQNHFVAGDLQFIRAGKTALTAHLESIEVIDTIRELDFAPSPDATQLHRRISLSSEVAARMIMDNSAPIYPIEAKKAGISGKVTLQAVIGVDGLVVEAQAVSGPPELQQAAIKAVKAWKFKPFLLNGEPLEVNTTINVVFTLQE
jgi:TonB family protein